MRQQKYQITNIPVLILCSLFLLLFVSFLYREKKIELEAEINQFIKLLNEYENKTPAIDSRQFKLTKQFPWLNQNENE